MFILDIYKINKVWHHKKFFKCTNKTAEDLSLKEMRKPKMVGFTKLKAIQISIHIEMHKSLIRTHNLKIISSKNYEH